jgi:hypothetical protein
LVPESRGAHFRSDFPPDARVAKRSFLTLEQAEARGCGRGRSAAAAQSRVEHAARMSAKWLFRLPVAVFVERAVAALDET